MTKQATKMGGNLTGIQMAPAMSEDMIAASKATEITIDLTNEDSNEIRRQYLREADPVGSVPPPGTIKGMAKAGGKMLTGKRPQAFIDKLGERLSFERSGVRLYDALILKCELKGEEIPLDTLRTIREEELKHFFMLKEVIESIGADPTAVTPAADVAAVASMGLFQVVTNPSTTVAQSLEAVLFAELADSDCWYLLTELATEAGFDDLVEKFREASKREEEHLQNIRSLVRKLCIRDQKLAS